MKKWLVIFLLCARTAQSQTRLAVWTFDGLTPAPGTPTMISPVANGDDQALTAELFADGSNGSSSWKTTSAGNELTSQAGTILNDPRTPANAGNALTIANSSANGKSIVLKFSMTGLRDPMITYAARSTATGFSTHTWSWSTDGISFSAAESYSTNRTSVFYVQTLDLSAINELDGTPTVYLKLTLAGATASSGNNRIDNINISATVPTPPVFVAGFPKVNSVTAVGCSGAVMLTAVGKVHFVVLNNLAMAPSSTQVKAHLDGGGNTADKSGSFEYTAANSEYQFEIHELTPETHYIVFIVAENADGLQFLPVPLEIITPPEGDHEPPAFKELFVNAPLSNALVVKVRLNEPGNVYSVAVDSGTPPPTVRQVIGGLDSEGVPVTKAATTVWRSDIKYMIAFGALPAFKSYDLYVVAVDTAGNAQPAVTKVSATTLPSNAVNSPTFKVATYNLEFFGSNIINTQGVEFGPADDTLQTLNVAALLDVMGADVVALEEVSNEEALNEIVARMPSHKMVLSDRWSHSWQAADPQFPPQKIGFLYDTRVATLVEYEVLFLDLYDSIQAGKISLADYPAGDATAFWSSGRLPFAASFEVKINDVSQRIRLIVIHSKSGSAPLDYSRRAYDVQYLFDYLSTHFVDEKIILLGDFNDDVDRSVTSASSPYQPFVDDDADYHILTYDLSLSGSSTFPATNSFIDHVIISSELNGAYVANSVAIVHADEFVDNYLETTSDHLPVLAEFVIKRDQSIVFTPLMQKTFGEPSFLLTAHSTSSMPIVYTSNNPEVALIEDDKLTIVKPGMADIIASQSGNLFYYPAKDISQRLVVGRASQTISFQPVHDLTVGDGPFNLVASSSSALPVQFSTISSNLKLVGNQIVAQRAGQAEVVVTQSGNEYFLPASANVGFCIAPVTPAITADFSVTTLSSNATSGNQWFFNDEPISGETGPVLKAVRSGKYKVQVKVDNCASVFSNEIAAVVTGDISQHDIDFRYWPSPAARYLEINGVPELSLISVYDLLGKECDVAFEKSEFGLRVFVAELATGTYFLRINLGGQIKAVRFIKQ